MTTAAPTALAPYAAHDADSRGRRFKESAPAHRSEFQRDRDRIIHSNAFRRLIYKTQVFVNHEGDLYRTRLTHTMEVAQIARTIARALSLNETLTEAICLAHDLGHTAFGHAGQDALNECMRDYGGFEHNLQSLRVVDELEERYAGFNGLNLCFETREGILKHCSLNNAKALGELGQRFIERSQPSAEAQLANLADEIAYNNHDVDDGLRSGLITTEQLDAVPLFKRAHDEVARLYPQAPARRAVHETIRRMINRVVSNVIETSAARLQAAAPAHINAVRHHGAPLIAMSEAMHAEHLELKQFLHHELYRHYKVRRMTTKARRVVQQLFVALMDDPQLMPPEHAQAAEMLEQGTVAAGSDGSVVAGKSGRARAVADYIAGMTDRYAILEHRRLFDPGERT